MTYKIIFILFTITFANAVNYFICPYKKPFGSNDTITPCVNSNTNSYDSLITAIKSINFQSGTNYNLLLIATYSQTFYLMNKEAVNHYDYTNGSSIINYSLKGNIRIKPVYCDDSDSEVQSITNFNTLCISSSQSVTMYVKTQLISFTISNTLSISRLIFNSSDDISNYNNQSFSSQICPYQRSLCCPTTANNNQYNCSQSAGTLTIANPTTSSGLFILSSNATTQLTLTNTVFANFNYFQQGSLISVQSAPTTISITSSVFDKNYFPSGTISIQGSCSQTSSCHTITVTSTNFTNYNIDNIMYSNGYITNAEGYFIQSIVTFIGQLTIQQSIFLNNSLSNPTYARCPNLQSFSNYQYLYSSSNPPANITLPFYIDNYKQTTSSIMYFLNVSGIITINNSTFNNNTGVSGTALAILNTISGSTITITNSFFIANYAVIAFATIRVSQINNDINSNLNCPTITISNNNFLNNTGCNGAYGNMMFFCSPIDPTTYTPTNLQPGQQQPGNTNSPVKALASINLFDTVSQNLINRYDTTQTFTPLATFTNNNFSFNNLAVSNCISMVGYIDILIDSNNFNDNGVTIERYGQYSSYITLGIVTPQKAFTQTSVLYLSLCSKIKISNNVFNDNWQLLTTNFVYGTYITLDNLIAIGNTTILSNNIFTNSTGLPSYVLQNSSLPSSLNQNFVTMPLITISLAFFSTTNTQLQGFINQTTMLISNCTFSNNQFNASYSNFTYNSIMNLYSSVPMNLINFYTAADISDSTQSSSYPFLLNFTIFNSKFTNNQMGSSSCFLEIYNIDNAYIVNSTIQNNLIYQLTSSNTPNDATYPSYDSVISSNQGFICFTTPTVSQRMSTSTSYYNVFLTNDLFKSNQGVLINGITSFILTLNVTNATFIQNTCSDFSLFAAIGILLNIQQSIFTSNINKFGLAFLDVAGGNSKIQTYTGSNNTFITNTGSYVSIFYIVKTTAVETSSIFTQNQINPTNYLFSDDQTPQAAPIYLYNSATFTTQNCLFNNNTAYAGLFVGTSSNYIDQGSTFINSSISGITLLANLNGGDLKLVNTYIVNNSFALNPNIAFSNAAFLILYSTTSTLNNCTFINNSINDISSSLVFSLDGSMDIESSAINSTDQEDNGQFLLKNSFTTITVANTIIANNSKLFQILKSSQIFFKNTIFYNNSGASNDKTLIQLIFSTNTTFLNCQFIDDGISQQSGQFIYIFLSTIYINNTSFLNFIATQGGALVVNKGSIIVQNSTFYNNSISSGAAICSTESNDFYINDSSFNGGSHLNVQNNINPVIINNTNFTNFQDQNGLFFSTIGSLIIQNIIVTDKSYSQEPTYPTNYIQFINVQYVTFSYSTLSGLSSRQGVLFISLAKASEFNITNSILSNNRGLTGGVIYADLTANSTIYIYNSTFNNNSAVIPTYKSKFVDYSLSGFGGVIYFSSSNTSSAFPVIDIQASNFTNNYATVAGGVVYSTSFLPILSETCIFTNNTARYGNISAAYPVRLAYLSEDYESTIDLDWESLLDFHDKVALGSNNRLRDLSNEGKYILNTETSPSNLSINNIPSGLKYTSNVKFALIDIYGQITSHDNSSTFIMVPNCQSTEYQLKTTNSLINAVNGTFKFTDITLTFNAGAQCQISFSSPSIKNLPVFLQPYAPAILVSQSLGAVINFRNCSMGEIYDPSTGACESCKNNTYALNFENNYEGQCLSCPTGAYCIGNSTIGPQNGYWRMNSTASLIISCPYFYACIGNDNATTSNFTETASCADYYQGNLCASCIDGMASYGSENVCVNCSNNALYYVRFFGTLLLQIVLIAYSVKCTLESSAKDIPDEGSDPDISKSNLIKILTNYLQIVSIISDFPFKWPSTVDDLFSANKRISISGGDAYSVDCFLALGAKSLTGKIFYFKLTIILAAPYILIFFTFLVWLAIFYKRKQSLSDANNRELFKEKLIASIIVLMFNLQPTLLQSAFYLFQCKNLYRDEDGYRLYYLKQDYDSECWAYPHYIWATALGIPNIAIWGILLPYAIFMVLRRNRKKLDSSSIKMKYAFIYRGYRKERFYWEFIIMMRKFLLIVVLVFVADSSAQIQAIFVLLIVLSAFIVHNDYNPFQNNDMNVSERLSLISSAIFDITGLYFLDVSGFIYIAMIMIVLFLAANIYFCLIWVKFFIKYNWAGIKKTPIGIKITNCLKRIKINLDDTPSANGNSEHADTFENDKISHDNVDFEKPPVGTKKDENQNCHTENTPIISSLSSQPNSSVKEKDNTIQIKFEPNNLICECVSDRNSSNNFAVNQYTEIYKEIPKKPFGDTNKNRYHLYSNDPRHKVNMTEKDLRNEADNFIDSFSILKYKTEILDNISDDNNVIIQLPGTSMSPLKNPN